MKSFKNSSLFLAQPLTILFFEIVHTHIILDVVCIFKSNCYKDLFVNFQITILKAQMLPKCIQMTQIISQILQF